MQEAKVVDRPLGLGSVHHVCVKYYILHQIQSSQYIIVSFDFVLLAICVLASVCPWTANEDATRAPIFLHGCK
jgi:hypothetical protein